VDCERSAGWDPVQTPQELEEQFTGFEIAHATNARARGKASCHWQFQPRAGAPGWCELRADRAPGGRFDAVSIWLKNPAGSQALLWLKLQDADGVVYTIPGILIGAEKNWYEIAFNVGEYLPAAGTPDPRPGISFPVKSIGLVLEDLRPDQEYMLYLDELRVHTAPPAQLDVVELTTPRQARAGESLQMRFRLRAQSEVRESLSVRVALALAGANACTVTVPVPVPAEGASPGDVLPAVPVQLTVPPFVTPGDYDVTLDATGAVIHMPDKRRLPTSTVRVLPADPDAAPVGASIAGDPPGIAIGGEPVRVYYTMADPSDPREFGALTDAAPDVVRFRIALGGTQHGCVTVPWASPDAFDFTDLDAALTQILSAAPSARVLPDVLLVTPEWWLRSHPSDQLALAKDAEAYTRAPHPSLSSETWRQEMGSALETLVRHLESAPFARHIVGYELSAGFEGRWLSWDLAGDDLGDYSPAQRLAFQMWLQGRYGSLERLRAAWGQPARPANDRPGAVKAIASWAEIDVPDPAARRRKQTWLIDPVGNMAIVDYRLFASQATVEAIAHFAAVVKAASGGTKLCGAAYGQFMALEDAPADSGHLGLTGFLQLRDIDFIVGPPASGPPGHLVMPAGSIARAGKALLSGLSSSAGDPWERVAAQMTQSATVSVSAAMPLRGLRPWFDGFNGASVAKIGVIVDDMSVAYMARKTPMIRSLFAEQIDQIARLGSPVDVWTLDDFTAGGVPPYSMYLFMNAFQTGQAFGQAVQRQLRDGDVAVWVCAPGAIGPSFSGRRMKALTGIATSVALSHKPLTATIESAAGLTVDVKPPLTYGQKTPASPHFQIFDPRVEVLGAGPDGRPTLVAQRVGAITSVYSAAPAMPAALLRSIARSAGVTIHNDSDDRLMLNASLMAVTAHSDGERIVRLPAPADVYEIPGGRAVASGAREFVVNVTAGSTRLFLLRRPVAQ